MRPDTSVLAYFLADCDRKGVLVAAPVMAATDGSRSTRYLHCAEVIFAKESTPPRGQPDVDVDVVVRQRVLEGMHDTAVFGRVAASMHAQSVSASLVVVKVKASLPHVSSGAGQDGVRVVKVISNRLQGDGT